jgi:23S rRNA pseudouridine1911/1915/1917 synthase
MMAVRTCGRAAGTHREVLELYVVGDGAPVASLIACRLETGRTHQIRVHLASIGHPLLGDEVYGAGFRTKANQLADEAKSALAALGRQALHAYLLVVEHPSQGTNLEFRSELPDDLLRLRHSLGAQGART